MTAGAITAAVVAGTTGAMAQEKPNAKAAFAYQTALIGWAQSLLGPAMPVPANAISVQAEGDHYVFRYPLLAGTPLSEYTFKGVPQKDGHWLMTGGAVPSPFRFEADVPAAQGTTEHVTYRGTYDGWTSKTLFDPTFAAPSTSETTVKNLQVTTDAVSGTGSRTGSFSVATGVGAYSIVPTADERIAFASQSELTGYRLQTSTPTGTAIETSFGRVRVTMDANDVSRPAMRRMVREGMAAATEGAIPQARGQALLRTIANLLPDLVSGISMDEAFEDAAISTDGIEVAMAKGSLAMAGKSTDGRLGLAMTLSVDGLAIPVATLGPAARLVPRRLTIPIRIDGIPSATASDMIRTAAETGTPPGGIEPLIRDGTVTATLDGVEIEMGGATAAGTMTFAIAGQSRVSGVGRVTARNLDALQRTLAANPNMAKGSAALALAKGLGRSAGSETVWDIRLDETGKAYVNGQDVGAMLAAGRRR